MITRNSTLRPATRAGHGKALAPIAAALVIAASQQANAFQFKTDGDWNIRWDNTVKYNYMIRAENQSDDVLLQGDNASNGILADDSDLGWEQWDTVSNRFDLFSEMDVVWKDKMGFRVSGAAWYDFAYDDSNYEPNPAFPLGTNTWGSLSAKPGEFQSQTQDLHETDWEVLDAFAFFNFTAGDVTGNVRAGRHTIYWGNSLLLTGAVHGVAGSMIALDVAKALSVPGVEANEVFLPTNKLSTVVQVTPNLTLNAYYSLEWEEYRLPGDGSYFSPAEILTNDSEFLMLAPGFGAPGDADFRPRIGQLNISDAQPDDDGEWGFNVQYYFNSWDFEAQVFYLNYADKVQNGLAGTLDFGPAVATFGAAGVPPFDTFYPDFASAPAGLADDALGIGAFNWAYKEDIDLFGFALSKEIAGMSFGLEYVFRQDVALRPDLGASIQRVANIPDPLKPLLEGAGITEFDINAVDTDNNYPGPIGDSQHLIINTVGVLNGSPLWDGGSFVVEVVASWVSSIDQNEEYFLADADKNDISTGFGINFNPEYYQVFAGTDLKIPMSVSYTLDNGNEPAIGLGGNPGIGNASIGAEFNIDQTWTVGAKYNAYFGEAENGLLGLLVDRDNISFTVKRTF